MASKACYLVLFVLGITAFSNVFAFVSDPSIKDVELLEEAAAREVFKSFHSNLGRESKYARESKEFEDRFKIFWENMKFVSEHNQKGLSWTVALNHLADFTKEELASHLGVPALSDSSFSAKISLDNSATTTSSVKKMVLPSRMYQINATYDPFPKATPGHSECTFRLGEVTPPETADWREAGKLTPVKDQKQAGSSWAYAATAALESVYAIKTGTLLSFSEQVPLDCRPASTTEEAYKWFTGAGVMTLDNYPYAAEGVKQECDAARWYGSTEFYLDTYEMLPPGENNLKKALAVQPVSVNIDASSKEFLFYASGVFDPKACSDDVQDLNHAVTAVGYVSGDQGYWIVRNSWSSKWGEEGYFKLAMNRGEYGLCGIARIASRPVLDGEDEYHLHSHLPLWAVKAREQVAKNVLAHNRTIVNPPVTDEPSIKEAALQVIQDEVKVLSKMARKFLG